VPEKEPLGHMRLRLRLPALLELLLVAGGVGAVGENVGGEDEPFPVGGPPKTVDVGWKGRSLRRLAAGQVEEIDLGSAVAIGEEGDPRSVGRERRVRIARLPRGQA